MNAVTTARIIATILAAVIGTCGAIHIVQSGINLILASTLIAALFVGLLTLGRAYVDYIISNERR